MSVTSFDRLIVLDAVLNEDFPGRLEIDGCLQRVAALRLRDAGCC